MGHVWGGAWEAGHVAAFPSGSTLGGWQEKIGRGEGSKRLPLVALERSVPKTRTLKKSSWGAQKAEQRLEREN